MDITTQFAALSEIPADWLIVPYWEEEPLAEPVRALDARLGGTLQRLQERGDLSGKARDCVPILEPRNVAAARLMLVGLGQKAKFELPGLIAAAAAAAKAITGKAYE